MPKTLEFKVTNPNTFIYWIKKFASIDNSLMLEIDEQEKEFVAKSHNAEKSIVKYSKLSFADCGFEISGKSSAKSRVRMGISHIPRLIKSLEHFTSGEFSLGFKYEELIGENEGLAGTDILLKNDSLKMNIKGASLHIFKILTDDTFLNKIAKVDPKVSFELSNSQINKIKDLGTLDNEYKYIDFKTRDSHLFIKGKTFELKLADSKDSEASITIYKAQFEKVDVENYRVDIAENRIVYHSKDSDTITVTSMVVRDEKYDESANEI